MIIVPFLAKLRGMNGEIKNYAEYLFTHSGGYVLSWIIRGAGMFISNGCKIILPECVKQATSQYKECNNWIRDFLDECCEIDPSYTEKSGKLFSCFTRYCDRVGIPRKTPSDFKKAITSAGFTWQKGNAGAIYYGIKLAEASSDLFSVTHLHRGLVQPPVFHALLYMCEIISRLHRYGFRIARRSLQK